MDKECFPHGERQSLEEKLSLFDPGLPLAEAQTIPSLWYRDPEIAEAESQKVFRRTWQVIGRADQLAEPGAFFTSVVAGEPILVARGGDASIRAFSNVCRHRAALVEKEAEGIRTKFRCRYHGWTYGLDGQLLGAPEFGGVANFPHGENGLAGMHVETLGPLVAVHMGKDPPPLPHALGPLSGDLVRDEVAAMRFAERRTYDLRCNWKVYVENFLDGGYHVNTVHPGLAGALNYKEYRTELFEAASVQISPLKESEDPSIAQVRAGSHASYWWAFPNFMVNVYEGVMDTNLVLPLGPDRCRVIFDFYFSGGHDRSFIDRSIAVAEQVQREDMEICEEVQRGLRSSSYSTGRYSVKREAGVHHFHQLLAASLRSSP